MLKSEVQSQLKLEAEESEVAAAKEEGRGGRVETCQKSDESQNGAEDLALARAPNGLLGHGSPYQAIQTSAFESRSREGLAKGAGKLTNGSK